MITNHDQRQRHQRGTAIIVVIAIISILLIFAMGNVRTLDHLGKELRLLDQQQRARVENLRL
jgi:Tfp pilus assembly protein PilX